MAFNIGSRKIISIIGMEGGGGRKLTVVCRFAWVSCVCVRAVSMHVARSCVCVCVCVCGQVSFLVSFFLGGGGGGAERSSVVIKV